MKKRRVTGWRAIPIIVLIFVLQMAVFWFRPLGGELPDEAIAEVVILEGNVEYTLDESAQNAVLTHLKEVTVTPSDPFEMQDGDGLVIRLYPENRYQVRILTLWQDSRICIHAPDIDQTSYYFTKEPLYEALLGVMAENIN